MLPIKSCEMLLVSVMMMFAACTAMKVDLAQLLNPKRHLEPGHKRVVGGNPCEMPEKPFPCSSSSMCIPMVYVCDQNIDCDDASDEKVDMCTALDRPPVEDIQAFLMSQKSWMIPNLFGNKPLYKVAHGLAVSQTIDDFKRRLGLSGKDVKNLRTAIDDVRHDDDVDLEDRFKMPSSAWNEVSFFFNRLIKAGFA